MSDENAHIAVAIIVDDQVVAATDNVASVRVAASLIAGERRRAQARRRLLLEPIAEGRRTTCRMIAQGAT